MLKGKIGKTCLWAIVVVIGLLAMLVRLRSFGPKRILRQHVKVVSKEFEHLNLRIRLSYLGNAGLKLSKKQAQEDLDELEWLLENRYSYLKRKGIDYKTALDSIRSSLGDNIRCGDFSYQLMKFLALFGDGHSQVASSTVRLKSLCSQFLPFLIEESNGRLVAFKADRTAFLDTDHPYLLKIEGIPLGVWIEKAGQLVAQGSSQYVQYHSIRTLRYFECLHQELGLPKADHINIELASADGSSIKQMIVTPAKKCPIYGLWPRSESRILKENIGYLRIPLMDDKFKDAIVADMNRFKDTDGLIIDIRGNGGGSRGPLRSLFPFFMAENDPPRVVNLAAYRLGVTDRKKAFKARYLHPLSWPHWSKAERDAIQPVSSTFKPQWQPAQDQFSQWHYFVVSQSPKQSYFHYTKPTVILMERWNFSACDIFLGAFKGWNNITLLGLPSGGGSGCKESYRLHHSQIRISLSSMVSCRPDGRLYDGHGIQPDVIMHPASNYFIGITDTTLDAAVKYINKQKQQI